MENSRNREMEQEIRKSMEQLLSFGPVVRVLGPGSFVQPDAGGILCLQLREKKCNPSFSGTEMGIKSHGNHARRSHSHGY